MFNIHNVAKLSPAEAVLVQEARKWQTKALHAKVAHTAYANLYRVANLLESAECRLYRKRILRA